MTTSAEGQGDGACSQYGTTGIANDMWFQWTAPATAFATLSFCGKSQGNPKVAVRAGSFCSATVIACADDAHCGASPVVSFAVASGSTYTIQVGRSPADPGAVPAAGRFSLCLTSQPSDCNTNGLPDSCETELGVTPDCNANSVPDGCDIAGGSSHDVNGNGAPDECEAPSCELAQLRPPAAAENDNYGWSVAASGRRLLIGEPETDGAAGINQGEAHVYRRDGISSVLEASLVPLDAQAGDRFGYAVTLSGDTAAIGAFGDDDLGASSGSVYVYQRNPTSGVWSQSQKLLAPGGAAVDYFGFAVELHEPYLFVGAPYRDVGSEVDAGSVYVFRRNGSLFTHDATLPAPSSWKSFGWALDCDGAHLAVGAPITTGGATEGGAAALYRVTGTAWVFDQGFFGYTTLARLGHSVAVKGPVAVFGAPQNTAYGHLAGALNIVYDNPSDGIWQVAFTGGGQFAPSGTNDWDSLGTSVLITDDLIIAGAPFRDTPVNGGAGVAWVWGWRENGEFHMWPRTSLYASAATFNAAFGVSLAWSDGVLVGGAYGEDGPGQPVDSGAVSLFALLGSDCDGDTTLDLCEIQTGTQLDANGNGVPDACEIVSFCFGDGSGTGCPCSNNSPPGNQDGCRNSLGLDGRLRASGSPSVTADTLVLLGSGMPNSSALYFQGTAQQNGGNGSVFGDGLRCAAGSVLRLGTKFNSGNSSQFPVAGDQPVSIRGMIPAGGGTRHYQCWYRNAAAFCTASTFNLTNGLTVVWSP